MNLEAEAAKIIKSPAHSKATLKRIANAMNNFTGTGELSGGLIEPTDHKYIPKDEEVLPRLVFGRPAIVRLVGDQEVVLATPNSDDVTEADAVEWRMAYSEAFWPERCEMLNVEQPELLDRRLIQQKIDLINKHGSLAAAGQTSKVKMNAPNAAGVQVGGSAEVKRITWNGHSGFSLARWMGSRGWTGAEAIKVFETIGIPMGKTAITGGVYAGKKGTRGEPAAVTVAQAAELEKVRNPDSDAAVEAASAANAKATPEPTKPTAKKSKAEKRREHDDKVMAAAKAKRNAKKGA